MKHQSKSRTQFVVAALMIFISINCAAQQWIPLKNKIQANPFNGVDVMLLLSDGTVMAQICTASVACGNQWARLTPDSKGSYVNGTWSMRSPMKFHRYAFCSAVLPNGKVFIIGGEQTDNLSGGQGEIYDPVFDKWTLAAPIPKALFDPASGAEIDDAQSATILGNKVMIAPVRSTGGHNTIIYDPSTDSWSAGASFPPGRNQDEVSWVKLSDNSILAPDLDNVHSERYIPATNQWIDDAVIPTASQLFLNSEMGAALLLPNGKAFFIGGTGHTLIYSPSGNTNPGTWLAGPDIPAAQKEGDAPAAMMSDGKILLASNPNVANGGGTGVTSFYQYDYAAGANGKFTPLSSPSGNTGDFYFLDLPDGNILTAQGADVSGQLYIFKPAGSPLPAGKPVISNIKENLNGTYHLTGIGLNGISAGAAFGDDAQMDSNYPLVRLTDKQGNIFYARTFNWNSTSVMTGNTQLSTEFTLPNIILSNSESQTYSLEVVTNGISSDPIKFNTPYRFKMNSWTGAWGSDGPIFTGDLNGDGKTDVFMWRNASRTWTVNLSSGNGFNQREWRGMWGSDGPIFTGDLNGDGKTDVFMWRNASHTWTVNLSTGNGFIQQEWRGMWGSDGPIFTGDLNGDGKTDVFMWRNASHTWTVNLSTGNGFIQQEWRGMWGSDGPIFTGDLNGDGKTDVFMWRNASHTWTVNLSTGNGFIQQEWRGMWGSDGPIFTGDLNGDGKTDVFMWRNATHSWTVNLSTGNGFIQQEWMGTWGSDGPVFVTDLNGDHKADILVWRAATNSWMVNLSTGNGFIQQEWKGAWGSDGPIFTGDLNGDGKTDVFMWRTLNKTWSINISP